MLPARHRMRRGRDFTQAVRRGRRCGRPTLVGHLWQDAQSSSPPLVGFVVSRAVGPAVVRARTKRRLRHLVSDRLRSLPEGTLLVIRANPPAAQAPSAGLSSDLDAVLQRLLPPTAVSGPEPDRVRGSR